MSNNIIERGRYYFDDDYKLVRQDKNKNGLFFEEGILIYYRNGSPCHAGIVKDGDDIYYISSEGKAVKGEYDVHRKMSNGIIEHGTYTFGDDYKLIPDSYIPPRKRKRKVTKHRKMQYLTIAVVAISLAVMIGFSVYNRKDIPINNNPTVQEIELSTFDEEVLLCSDTAKKAYDGQITVAEAISSGNPYLPFIFEYKLNDQDGKLILSESKDLSNGKEYALLCKENSISIDNLKVNTEYYYQVIVDDEVLDTDSFKTAVSTRFINMPGVYNTRDIGDYTTLDGKVVKQGKLIRGTEIDGLVEPKYFLKNDAIDEVQETFGFVTDLDLREASLFNGKYQSRLGSNVKHKFYNSPMYGSIFSLGYQPALKLIISDLADQNNYPMYLHCTYGADRTGTICFILEAILNCKEEDMRYDYQLTGFVNSSYADGSNIDVIYAGVEAYEGNNIQEKIVNYLISEVGVTPQEIDSIRNIFLD